MSRFLWQADELAPDEVEEDLAERFNPHQPRDRDGKWTDGGGSSGSGGAPGGGTAGGGGQQPGTGTRTFSTSGRQVSVSRRADGTGTINLGTGAVDLTPNEFSELQGHFSRLEVVPNLADRVTRFPVGSRRVVAGDDGSTLAVIDRTGRNAFSVHLRPRPGAGEQETAAAPGLQVTSRDASLIDREMGRFEAEKRAAEDAEREAIRQERIRTGATNPADVARRAASRPPATRDPGQRGMPEAVVSEQVTPAGGGPAVGVHKLPGSDAIHVSQGDRSVALTSSELSKLEFDKEELDDLGVGESMTVTDSEGFTYASITRTGRDTFDVGIDGRPALTGVRASDISKISRAGERIQGSGRVDTDFGPVDVFAAGRKVGIRHIGDDGRPVEVQITRSNASRIESAMAGLEDEDLAPGESAFKDIKTTAGTVRVELRGPWGQPGSKLYLSPADGSDAWGAIVDGPNMDAFREQFGALTESRRLGEQVNLVEAAGTKTMTGRRFRARLIKGDVQGSSGYYTADTLREHAAVFHKGLPIYIDHPTLTERQERPERSVRDLAGHLASDAMYERDGLYADIEVYPHWAPVIEAMWPHIGMSIRASGTVEASPRQDIPGPIVTSLTHAESVDFVTKAGAGGQVVALLESARRALAEATVSDKPWSDITQADYSIEQWRRACLIGPEEQSDAKADYKLPVREPDGTLNRNAVHAAAARIGQVDAPASVIKAAARKLAAAYDQLDEDPPESLTRLAGLKEAHMPDDDEPRGAGAPVRLREGRNLGAWMEARLHRAFTEMADDMYGEGRLTREERIALSSAIGDALGAFAARVEGEHPQLFERDIYDDPEPPAAQGTTPTRHPKEGSMPELTDEQAKALAEAAAVRTELDDTRTQLNEAIARLNEATEHIAGLKKRLDDSDEANLRLARDRDARALMAEALAESGLPARTHARVTESACRDLPTRQDGTLDADAFRELAEKAIAEEKTYLASALEEAGYGKVRGLGDTKPAEPVSEADYTANLAESFKRLGLSAEAAAIAAAGRN